MAKKKQLTSGQLLLEQMSPEDIQRKIVLAKEEELDYYSRILKQCKQYPDQISWYAPWIMRLKKQKTVMGDISVSGLPEKGQVSLTLHVNPEYRDVSLLSDAIRGISRWVFARENVYYIDAGSALSDPILREALEKNGFEPNPSGSLGKEKPKSVWMPIYMCLGSGVGMSLGIATGNPAIGMCMGVAVGMAMGASLDSADRKKRRDISREIPGSDT